MGALIIGLSIGLATAIYIMYVLLHYDDKQKA